jgi:RhtB (resistance to homoserine/threonine) family protein
VKEFLLVAGIHLLAVMSPGPDFAMVLKTSIANTRRSALWLAAGIGLGILVHVAYSIIGIGFVIARSILLFNIIKWLGALYLIYIGIQALRSKPVKVDQAVKKLDESMYLPYHQALLRGFLTNALNPKATLFFLALFTQVISASTPNIVKIAYGVEMSVITFAWFAVVGLVLTHDRVRRKFVRIKHYIERAFGGLLVLLGIKVALSDK